MQQSRIQRIVHLREDRLVQLEIPAEFGDAVEIVIVPADNAGSVAADAGESGFLREVIASPEEDCWNDV